jgi:hypothetical protein
VHIRKPLIAAPLLVLALVTCARGPVMTDLGGALMDVGAAMGGDAQAQQMGGDRIEFVCNNERTWRQQITQDYLQATTTFYADISSPDLDPMNAAISAYLCDWEYSGEGPGACNALACTGDQPPLLRCRPASYSFDVGRIIVRCGGRTETTAGGMTTTGYSRAQRGYLVIK